MIKIIEIDKKQLDFKRAAFLENYMQALSGTQLTIEPVLVSKKEIAALRTEYEAEEHV